MIDEQKKWRELLKHNVRIQDVYSHAKTGDDLQMISPFLEAMTLVSAAKTLKKGASSMFLGLYLATVGVDKETSHCGFVGKSMNQLIDHVSNAILSEAVFSPKSQTGTSMLIKKIVKATAILSVAAAKLLKSKMEASKNNEATRVYVELLLLMLSRSNVLKNSFKEFVKSCGGDEKTENRASEILSLFALLLAGYSLEKQKGNFQPIFDLLHQDFYGSIEKVDELLSFAVADSTIDGEQVASLHAALGRAKLSLQEMRCESFLQAIEMGLESIRILKSDLILDILEIEKCVGRIHETILTGLTDFIPGDTEVTVVA